MDLEITAKIECDRSTAFLILENNGWRLVKAYNQDTTYWTHLDISDVVDYRTLITNSILVRDTETKLLIYKQKQFDVNGNVIGEEKFEQIIQDCTVVNKMFELAGFKNWTTTITEQLIFAKDKSEFCIQDVQSLGLYLEIENREGQTIDELIVLAKGLGLPLGDDFVGIKLPYLVYLKSRNVKIY